MKLQATQQGVIAITDREFVQFQRFIHETAGIALSASKKALVCGRLARRLTQCGVSSYGEYFSLLTSSEGREEMQLAVDLLTTNETYFFRESRHFDYLREHAAAEKNSGRTYRVWSAACSSGEEPYSIAMVLSDCLGDAPWEVVGTDISARVLARAKRGQYPLERTSQIPAAYLRKYCLRGTGTQQGTLLVQRPLRQRVRFAAVNLNRPLPDLPTFDVIFLRNVMIYFNHDTKREVVGRLLPRLRTGGHFYVGHSETLNEITNAVSSLAPSVYRKA